MHLLIFVSAHTHTYTHSHAYFHQSCIFSTDVKGRSTKVTKSTSLFDDSLSNFDCNIPEEDVENTRNQQRTLSKAKSKTGHINPPKRKAGKEREASKPNVETTNADILSRSRPRIGASFDTPLNDSMLFSFDDQGLEEDGEIIDKKQQNSKLTRAKSKMDGPRRAERGKEASKGNSSTNRVNSEDALCTKTQVSLKPSSQRKQQSRIITRGSKGPDEGPGNEICISEKEAKSEKIDRRKKGAQDLTLDIKTSSLAGAGGLASKICRGSIAAQRGTGNKRKVSEPGANSSSLSNGMVDKAYLRGKAKESALKREEENLKLSSTRVTRSMRIMTTANDKSVPSTPAQQVTLQEDKVTQQMTKAGQHNQMSNRELQKPVFEPRITRAMTKLVQDKKKETATMKLKHETSSKTNGIGSIVRDSQPKRTLGDRYGILQCPKKSTTVSDYADITDDLLLDSSTFNDLSDLEGDKLTESEQVMDGEKAEPVIIESKYS